MIQAECKCKGAGRWNLCGEVRYLPTAPRPAPEEHPGRRAATCFTAPGDDALPQAYQRTNGEPGNSEADALLAEIEPQARHLTSEWERWAEAFAVEQQHGENGTNFILERLRTLTLASDNAGVERWMLI